MNTKIAKKTNICQECTAYLPKDSSQCILCGHINKPTDGRVIQMPIQTGERSNREIYKSRELTIEEVKSLYFDPEALIEPAYRLYRIDSDSIRYYYTLDETIKPEFYTSVTSFIKLTVPPGIGLLKWMQSLTRADSR